MHGSALCPCRLWGTHAQEPLHPGPCARSPRGPWAAAACWVCTAASHSDIRGGGGVLWLHGGPGPRATDYERKCLSCVHKQLPPPPLRMSSAFRPLQLQVYLLRGNLRAIFPRITLASPRLPLPSPSHSPTACLGTPPGPGKAACGAKSGNRSEAWEQRQPRGLSQLKAHWGERGGGSPATQAGQHLGGRSCPRVRL